MIESAVYVHAPYMHPMLSVKIATYYGKATGPEKFNIYILAVTMLG